MGTESDRSEPNPGRAKIAKTEEPLEYELVSLLGPLLGRRSRPRSCERILTAAFYRNSESIPRKTAAC